MKRSRGEALATLAVLLSFVGGCAQTLRTTVRQHPDFNARRAKLTTVAVMPPDVDFTLVVFKGDNQPLSEEAAAVRSRLVGLLGERLEMCHFTVKEAALDNAHFGADPELRFTATQGQSSFARADAQMYRVLWLPAEQAESYRIGLRPEVVNRLADHAGVDALLFARMRGFKKSKGEVAKDVTMNVLYGMFTGVLRESPTQGAALQVALVDGTTGEVLWANAAGTIYDFEGKGLDDLVQRLFNPFPMYFPPLSK